MRTAGIILVASGVMGAVLFCWHFEKPALAPHPNGRYGEMYGPVMYARPFVYAAGGVLVCTGIVCAAWKRKDPNVRTRRCKS